MTTHGIINICLIVIFGVAGCKGTYDDMRLQYTWHNRPGENMPTSLAEQGIRDKEDVFESTKWWRYVVFKMHHDDPKIQKLANRVRYNAYIMPFVWVICFIIFALNNR